jgi:uncharacterized lipoprotein YddW (UPF0748 family)
VAAAVVLALLASVVLGQVPHAATPAAPREVRGLWVVRPSLTSPASIEQLVESASSAGFNTLLVQVRGRGDAYYLGGLDPRAEALSSAGADFDPLAVTIRHARARGLEVLAWLGVNLVSSAHDLPADPAHVVNRAPHWLMVPRALAQELSTASPQSPGYVGRLARWTRARSSEVEGLYVSPLVPAAATYTVSVAADIAARYDVDGVHLDYVRLPGPEFDYGRLALDEFRTSLLPRLTPDERRSLDARYREDVLAYADAFPQGWAEFRRSRMTALVMRLAAAVRAARPEASVTSAVVADAEEAARFKFQDWRRWLDADLLDAVCPMAYTADESLFESQIAAAARAAGTAGVWAGIGAYRLTPDQTVARIAGARRAGAEGVVLFSYDAMIEADRPPTYLVDVARGAFGGQRAAAGSR